MRDAAEPALEAMRAYSRTSGFNVLHGVEIARADAGEAELRS